METERRGEERLSGGINYVIRTNSAQVSLAGNDDFERIDGLNWAARGLGLGGLLAGLLGGLLLGGADAGRCRRRVADARLRGLRAAAAWPRAGSPVSLGCARLKAGGTK